MLEGTRDKADIVRLWEAEGITSTQKNTVSYYTQGQLIMHL